MLAFVVILYASCTAPYTTFTDTYYIHNATDNVISLTTEHPVVWDTCAPENPQKVWFDSTTIFLKAGKTIRLHPIVREFKYKSVSVNDRLNVTWLIGTSTRLTAGTDTIVWQVQHNYMFESDSVWSIYNKRDWQTIKDNDLPYTYYHTFEITSEKIERNKL